MIAGAVAIGGGALAIIASFLTWTDLAEVGLTAMSPTGFGAHHYNAALGSVGLGWVTVPLGVALILAGVMSLIGVSLAAPTIAGLGTALTVIGGAVWVWPFGLTLDRVELGASSLPATFGALGPGVILILVVGVLSMIVGSWAAYTSQPAGVGSHGSHGGTSTGSVWQRASVRLAVAGLVGVVIAVVAVLSVWLLLHGADAEVHG